MPRILVVGRDWRLRALLRAQLIEEGIEVEAYETAREALNTLTDLSHLPDLVVADLFRSRRPAAEVNLLVKWADAVPIWLILSRTLNASNGAPEKLGLERIVYRPTHLGRLVTEIQSRVGG